MQYCQTNRGSMLSVRKYVISNLPGGGGGGGPSGNSNRDNKIDTKYQQQSASCKSTPCVRLVT